MAAVRAPRAASVHDGFTRTPRALSRGLLRGAAGCARVQQPPCSSNTVCESADSKSQEAGIPADRSSAADDYRWSFGRGQTLAQEEGGKLPPQDPSTAPVQDLLEVLEAAASEGTALSPTWAVSAVERCVHETHASCAQDTVRALAAAAQLGVSGSAALAGAAADAVQWERLDSRQVAAVVWSVAQLQLQPPVEWLQAGLQRTQVLLPEFFGPDLCRLLQATADLAPQLPDGWVTAVSKEIVYQLREFPADFGALDVAALLMGLAGLGHPVDEELRSLVMRVVYAKMRSIEEKSAVDFALARADAGTRSLHYDPRWTYEELHWLPGHERDKRRIIKDNWYRTRWGGWSPGAD